MQYTSTSTAHAWNGGLVEYSDGSVRMHCIDGAGNRWTEIIVPPASYDPPTAQEIEDATACKEEPPEEREKPYEHRPQDLHSKPFVPLARDAFKIRGRSTLTISARLAAAESALTALRDGGGLSRNTADILERTLAG